MPPVSAQGTADTVSTSVISPQEYDTFRRFLEEASGIVLGDNKHYLVTSRLNRLTEEFGFASLGELLEALRQGRDRRLQERVVDAMTTNETSWFRDGYPYEMLKNSILPELAQRKVNPLRIWSAASSTGQEAYSISMVVHEFQKANPGALPGRVEIVGTDISASVVRQAREGKYDDLSMARGLSPERKAAFFTDSGDGGWVVRPEIRARTRFTELNLLKSYALLGRFEIIFCRNVLIYFSGELKRDILDRMAQVLNPGGYLFLGGSETPSGYSRAYEMVRFPEGVVYRKKD